MLPQPIVSSPQGSAMLDEFLSCHQWVALGIGIDPVSMLSERDLAILDALGARFIGINAPSTDARTLSLGSNDSTFTNWIRRHDVRGLLVRPDRFIAQRLDSSRDLSALNPFAATRPAGISRAAA
jgi:3-(3-hydroxy-phenyl)propionate hydroxylase